APPCNFNFAPNDCLDDYLETCAFQDDGATQDDCYTNGSYCCRCVWWPKRYICYGYLERWGQESTRHVIEDATCDEPTGDCISNTPGGGGN
ncbi:MAG TPA: hypothetical protein PKA27_17130, partial [Fimbriimonadaceae bacterium]|nr:hypothetical protein [Fimbriimonadaceae bacterium]